MADSLLKLPQRMRMPALVLPETPCEWVELYILAQNQPAKLLFYVDPKTCYGLEKRQPPLPQVGISGLNRLYALRLLGDTGGIEIIPALQSISAQYRQGGVSYSSKKQIAHVIDLTIERIRYRAKGRDAYIREMIRWVQSPEPPWEKSDEVIDYVERVVEAARALAVVGAQEAVPVLTDLCNRPWWDGNPWVIYLIRALAWLGDRGAMPVLSRELARFTPYQAGCASVPAAFIPLEVREPDPVLVYWQMRTEGKSLPQAIEDIIHSVADLVPGRFMQQEILREYVGPAAVPYLLRALAAPPTSDRGVDVQGVAAQLLGEWRVKEAVQLLIDLMHRARLWSLRGTAAIALGEIGSPEAVDALIAAADLQQDAELLASVADALGYLRDARAEAALMKLLQHPDAKVRYAAAKAIASSGTLRILPELEQRADQETVESVWRALVQAIERIRGQ